VSPQEHYADGEACLKAAEDGDLTPDESAWLIAKAQAHFTAALVGVNIVNGTITGQRSSFTETIVPTERNRT